MHSHYLAQPLMVLIECRDGVHVTVMTLRFMKSFFFLAMLVFVLGQYI